MLDAESEDPYPGKIVALDSEFVSIGEEGITLTSLKDDAKVVRPSPKTVARLSVLRADPGPLWGVPFIDDYIIPKEEVKDYLTAYSGIMPEDLDPKKSRRHLVSLKVAIKKLWILLNLGCKFIGHGLDNDFRELNICVPPSQRIDTLDLFQSPATKRRIGLSFLCWIVLGERIQAGTHDSIEDARTALRLWEKHREYAEEGSLEEIVSMIFAKGQNYGFRIPAQSGMRTGTPGPGAAAAAAAAGGWEGGSGHGSRNNDATAHSTGRTTPPNAINGGVLGYRPITPQRYMPGGWASSTPSTPFSPGRGSPMPGKDLFGAGRD